MVFDTSSFEVLKNVTREFVVIPEDGSPMYLKFESPFAVDESLELRTRRSKNDPTDEKKKEPMEVANVINLSTGEEARIVGNAVIKSELRSHYPNDGYVGHYFEFKQGAGRTGKSGNKYRSFKIVEIKIRETPKNTEPNRPTTTAKK